MNRQHSLLASVMAGAVSVVIGLASPPAQAQVGLALSPTVVKAHQDDLEAMLADLSKVQSADTARSYESYLAGQMPKYVANHKALHHTAMPGFVASKQAGKHTADQQKLSDAVDKLSDTHYPKLAAEMDRVEKLNPGLKKHFDVLRTLN